MNEKISRLFSLIGKVAIITGAAGLIGSQYAEVLSDAGAKVVIVDIDQKRCDNLAKKIIEKGGEAIGLVADISDENSIREMITKIKEQFGKVDILINNAVAKPANMFNPVEEYNISDWDKVMSVNLKGMFICCKLIGSEMVKQGKGVIINIGSMYGIVGTDQRIYGDYKLNTPAVYSASKGGVINLTRYLATYWAGKGIRVNCLSPGGVENNQDSNFLTEYSKRTPLGRMAKKEELRGPILFLASDASSYMTGANLVVDGGWTAW